MITKSICGILVYGYPCWNPDINYTLDKERIIEYGEHLYFNEKVLDITFDNTKYVHRLNPVNNPIFRLKEEVWKTVPPQAERFEQVGQRLKCLNPNTGEFVYFVSRGVGRSAPYTGQSFNLSFYSPLWGEANSACSIFNPISCATWEGLLYESKAVANNFTQTDNQLNSANLVVSPILFSKEERASVRNLTSWEGSF